MAEDGRVLALGRGRQRALLGMLLLRANEVIAQDVLVDALWGESPPPTALTALHGYVSRLRRLLDDDRLQTRPPGYALRVDHDELDLHRFERLLGQERYDEALALWRGPPLSDLAFESFAQSEIARLEELRLTALERRFERELGDGRHADLVGRLAAALREHPLRERLTAQLMLALYRAGRQADALAAFQAARAGSSRSSGWSPARSSRRSSGRSSSTTQPSTSRAARRRRTGLPALPQLVRRPPPRARAPARAAPAARARLLTLTGAGGTGKTRLALEIARRSRATSPTAPASCRSRPSATASSSPLAIAQALELRRARAVDRRGADDVRA